MRAWWRSNSKRSCYLRIKCPQLTVWPYLWRNNPWIVPPCLPQLIASWGGVMDGTGTPVATCMINKWTTKINGKGIYNGNCPPRRGERKKEGRRLHSLPPLKAFATKHKRSKEKKSQSLDQARGHTFALPPDDLIIPPPYDHVRLLELSLKPNSWAHFLYQIYCIGPVGFELICANSKEPPQR